MSRKRPIIRRALVFLVFLTAAAAVSGYDIGVTIDNSTGFNLEESPTLTQRDTVSHWFEANFGDRFSLAYQLSYTFDLERTALFELDLLKFSGEFLSTAAEVPKLFAFSVGRFNQREFSGQVFSHPADGVSLRLGLPFMNLGISAGYLGLLQGPTSSVILSASDVQDRVFDTAPVFGPLASPRLVESLTLQFPELFFRQTVDIALLFQQDLRSDAKLTEGGGRVNTQYYGIGLSGPIVSPLFHNEFFYFNSGQSDTGAVTGYIFGGGLDLFLKQALSSKLSAKFVYASGDGDHTGFYEGNTGGLSTAFIPLSASGTGIVFTPRQSNVFYGTVSYSIKPLSFIGKPAAENFSIATAVLPYFRSTRGPISTGGTDADSESLYLGTEWNFTISARPLSDLGLGYSMGFFFPGAGLEATNYSAAGRFDLSLSL